MQTPTLLGFLCVTMAYGTSLTPSPTPSPTDGGGGYDPGGGGGSRSTYSNAYYSPFPTGAFVFVIISVLATLVWCIYKQRQRAKFNALTLSVQKSMSDETTVALLPQFSASDNANILELKNGAETSTS